MDWEPLEIDNFHFYDDEEIEPEPCLNCYGRGQPRVALSEVRAPSKDTLLKYGDRSTKPKRGRGRAQVLRERVLQKAVGIKEETVSQESASLMDSASELDSSQIRLNSTFTKSQISANSKLGFMDKWLNSLDGQDVKFSEPNEQSQLPEGFRRFSRSHKGGPKRHVEDFLKVMDNITMVSRGRKSRSSRHATPANSTANKLVSRSINNDSTNAMPANSTVNESASRSFKNYSTNVTPATSTVNESSLEVLASLSEINQIELDEDVVKLVDDHLNVDDDVSSTKVEEEIEMGVENLINEPETGEKETQGEECMKDLAGDMLRKQCLGTENHSDGCKSVDMLEEQCLVAEDHNDTVEEVVAGASECQQEDTQVKESLPLVIENLPENCSLTTLLDIAGSYGEIKTCNFDKCEHSAVVVYYNQEHCDFAQENLDGEDGFFDNAAKLKAYHLLSQIQ